MAGFSARRAVGAVLVAVSAIVLRPELVGHVTIDKLGKLQQWANSAPLNNGACVVEQAANACEDVVVHFDSSTVFAACGDPRGRTKWYPPAGQRDVAGRSEASFRETLFKHDINTGKTTELKIEGVEGDFVTHGIDVWPSADDPTTVHIFAVRHTRGGDSVSIFSHKLGTDRVTLLKDVKHPNIYTANGVAATGPFEFYMTNDHYFFFDPWRSLEEKFGPWSWATNVQYCDASGEATTCKTVAGPYPAANGIAVWEDRLFVGDSQNGTLRVFQQHPNHDVEYLSQVELGAAADNIKIDPSTGDLIVAIFPTVENLPEYLANVEKLGKSLRVPAATLRLPKANGYTPELIYFDDGGVVSDMTAMAIDPYNNALIGAAVLQYGGFACLLTSGQPHRMIAIEGELSLAADAYTHGATVDCHQSPIIWTTVIYPACPLRQRGHQHPGCGSFHLFHWLCNLQLPTTLQGNMYISKTSIQLQYEHRLTRALVDLIPVWPDSHLETVGQGEAQLPGPLTKSVPEESSRPGSLKTWTHYSSKRTTRPFCKTYHPLLARKPHFAEILRRAPEFHHYQSPNAARGRA